jgi:hypothetical protein
VLGSFAGAAVTRNPLWLPGLSLHILAALLTIFGILGLYAVQREQTGVLGLVGFVLAIIGTTLFFADGLIALTIFLVRFLLLEQVECHLTQYCGIFGRLVFADATVIFVQSDIQDPMQIIFNGPVLANNVENAFRITGRRPECNKSC